MRIVDTTDSGIEEAVAALRQDQVIAYPTETVYGLGCNPFSEDALRRLFEVKKRDDNAPLLLLIGDRAQLLELSVDLSDKALRCMKAFWPGPVTLLLPALPGLPEAIVGPGDKVAVRHSSSPVATALCVRYGHPVTSTSANLSGERPALCPEEIGIKGISLCIDGGTISDRPPSTVYDPDTGKVVREGAVTAEALRRETLN